MENMNSGLLSHGRHKTHLTRSGGGKNEAILFLHGSGPGATGWSNWQYALPVFGERYDCLVPDLAGFGRSAHPDPPPRGAAGWMRLWVDQLLGLLDAAKVEKAHLVGNSLGGAVALHLLTERPDRFDRVVLMGAVGVPMKLTRELDVIWGFYDDPSARRMAQIITWFAYDESVVGAGLEQIAQMRYEAAMNDDIRRSFSSMFPAPRQQHLDEIVVPDAALRQLKHPALLVHGLNDPIVPVQTSYHLVEHLGGRTQLHVYSHCSHWTQIEYRESFHRLLLNFFAGEV